MGNCVPFTSSFQVADASAGNVDLQNYQFAFDRTWPSAVMVVTGALVPACDDADGTLTLSTSTYGLTITKDAVISTTWSITLY